MVRYPRGSEWRRWDLHVHTASSYDYKYNGLDADEKLAEVLKKETISAVAITDHFIIDKNRIENLRKLAPEIVFFPGVELRTDKGGTNIHVILIFSENIDLNILVEDFNVFKRSAVNHENNEKIYWDYRTIVDFAKKHDALISIHAGSKTSGIDDKITNALDVSQAVKEEYAISVNIFEMGKLKDIENYEKHVFPQIGPRPMIICSDNHDARNYHPQNKLWIKADPTFNGLKQILYEPRDRVRIIENKPEVKEDYYVIDRVEFKEDDFPCEPIYFNDKLTCIIGGKSTGKSILLQNIAYAIAPDEAQKSLAKSNNITRKINNFNVYWADGEQKDRKIIYIPQTYLNRLSDNKSEKTEIDQWIQDVLFQKQSIKNAYDKYLSELNTLKLDIDRNIISFLSYNAACCENLKEQREIGDKQGVITTLKKLSDEKTALSKNLQISEDDINLYNNALKNVQLIENNIEKLNRDKTIVPNILNLVQKVEIDPVISEDISKQITQIQNNLINMAATEWKTQKGKILEDIEKKITENLTNKSSYQDVISAKKPLIDSNQAVMDISKRIRDEEQKKKLLEEKEQQLDAYTKKRNLILEELCQSAVKYRNINIAYRDIIRAEKIEDKDISFSADVLFRSEIFINKLQSLYNTRSKEFKDIINDDFAEQAYTTDLIKTMIEYTIQDKLPLKSGITKENALRELCSDWYNTIYRVKMDGDTLDVMSPGKKALVLLKILVSLAESKCPILIDQPEDDLDNRSIYDDLIEFIKEKKKERQIIIVTHNANIVIGADAEEIIVANQDGKNCSNKEFKFEYRSGSIENDTPTYKENGTIEAGILNAQGIQQHVCSILEGGEQAFELRKKKYHITEK